MASLARLGANVAVAEPTLIGRAIAAWPSFALLGAYEMLMSQIRRTAEEQLSASDSSTLETGEPEDDGDVGPGDEEQGGHRHLQGSGRAFQRAAWQWTLANRRPDGSLPSGIDISRVFERSPRWGRLIKNAGSAGNLN